MNAGGGELATAVDHAPEGRIAALVRVARVDLLSLVLLVAAHAAALGVAGTLIWGHVATVRKTAELERRLRTVGDVDAQLAAVDRQVAAKEAEVAQSRNRMTTAVRWAALSARIEFRAKELELGLQPEPEGMGQTLALAPAGLPKLEVRRFARAVDVRGGFREFLTLLSEVEAWNEFVAVDSVSVRRGGKGAETLAHAELSVYELIAVESQGGKP